MGEHPLLDERPSQSRIAEQIMMIMRMGVWYVVLSTDSFRAPSRLGHLQAHSQPFPLLWSTRPTDQSRRLRGSSRTSCAMRRGGRRCNRCVVCRAVPSPGCWRLAARVIGITHFCFAVRTAAEACLRLSPLPLRCNAYRGPGGRARYQHRSGLLRRCGRYGDDAALYVRGPVSGRRAAGRRPTTIHGTLAGLR